MQISSANLLASQSQSVSRPREAAAAFEPISFKQTPQASVAADLAPPAASAAPAPTAKSGGTATDVYSGYVRPGTNLDIKV